METVVDRIRAELKASSDEKTRQSFQRFFKEKVTAYGVKTGTVEKIAKKFWLEVYNLSKSEVFELCEGLFRSGVIEEAFVVSFWLPKYVGHFEPSDLSVFEDWIKRFIDNWAKCDGFCNHTVGEFIEKYPEGICYLKRWAKNNNRWLKRAAAVSLIVPAKKGEFLTEALEICDLLIADKDDMVQKGYGWLLKEVSRRHQLEVFAYVLENRQTMPRIALRYAIELMTKELKAKAMEKS